MSRILAKSGAIMDPITKLYSYPNFQENYHMSLARILCEKLRIAVVGDDIELL
jgi:hypothetical protein